MTEEYEIDMAKPTTEAHVISKLALSAAEPKEIEPDKLYIVGGKKGGQLLDTSNLLRGTPVRKQGHAMVRDAGSFLSYLAKHGIPEVTEIWANQDQNSVIGVIDAHGDTDAGWREHLLNLELKPTPEWETWMALDGKEVSQIEFANHLEANAADLIEPSPTVFLEIAQSFQAKTNVDFKSAERLASGEVKFQFEEATTAKAGQKGELEIPTEFVLALKPYEGSPIYKQRARFRYKLRSGQLTMSYVLDRPHETLRSAFSDIVEAIETGITVEGAAKYPIFYGRP